MARNMQAAYHLHICGPSSFTAATSLPYRQTNLAATSLRPMQAPLLLVVTTTGSRALLPWCGWELPKQTWKACSWGSGKPPVENFCRFETTGPNCKPPLPILVLYRFTWSGPDPRRGAPDRRASRGSAQDPLPRTQTKACPFRVRLTIFIYNNTRSATSRKWHGLG